MIDITQVPFNKLLGITVANNPDYLLQLDAKQEYTNHLGTVHAAALFALAEGSGAQLLITQFPQNIVNNSALVLRKVNVAYKKPSVGLIHSQANFKDSNVIDLTEQLISKKKILFTTVVNLYNQENEKVFLADFEWFVALQINS